MTVLSPATVEEFRVNGFVLTTGLIDREELRGYAEAIDRAVAARTAGDERAVEDKGTYEQSFIQCMRLWETDPDVRPLTFHRALGEAASELLGEGTVRVWQDQALYKEAGGRVTDPHQDAPFWPIGDAPLVSAWIPLDDTTLDGGAMGYVPQSHRVGALKSVNLLHTTEPYDILRDPALAGTEPVFVEAPAGSVIWHHGFTVHQALANRTDHMRRAFTVVYLADGYRRAKPWPHFPLERAAVGVGELMAGEGLPIAWPRGAALPEPPTTVGAPPGPP